MELRELAQWVSWDLTAGGEKPPHSPHTDRRANAHDPAVWGTFEQAVQSKERAGLSGIGFVFTADDPYVGIDLDHCYEGDQLAPWAWEIVKAADSFTERSQSKAGVKIVVRASYTGGVRPSKNIEVYGSGQYFALTGDVIHDAPIRDAQDVIDRLTQAKKLQGLTRSPLRSVDTITYSRLSLAPGGPLRRADGTLRRLPRTHWLNQWLVGSEAPYYALAAEQKWDDSLSGVRFHGIDTLVVYGYPDDEIAAIVRELFPEDQGRPEDWWDGEVWRCLYKEDAGARARRPHIRPAPTRYAGLRERPLQTPVRRAPRGLPGRPAIMDADYLLRWYGEEAGKRLLEGPRARDAAALGISVATLDRLDRQLVERGAITIVKLSANKGRRVTLRTGSLWGLPAKVLSKYPPCRQGQDQRSSTPQVPPHPLVCKGSCTGGVVGGGAFVFERRRGRRVPEQLSEPATVGPRPPERPAALPRPRHTTLARPARPGLVQRVLGADPVDPGGGLCDTRASGRKLRRRHTADVALDYGPDPP